ncbi:site-2 protease family protein, partial [Arthrobacter sp. TB 26]|uniref:site-2 protease family protein n=1 Tax=Arthrobacter sp. TB 26 TaxID=494420 RepID=UPI0004626811
MTDTDTRGRSGQEPQKQGRKEGITLGRISGIPVILAYSWFIIAAFTVILYGPVLQRNNPELGLGAYVVAFAYAVLLLVSVLVHELAHALTAKIFGWPSEKIVLNLWGGHTQFESFTASPGRSVLVAMAGPAANFVLAAAGWLLLTGSDLTGVAGILANIFVWANLLISIFNVLPGLPLDGGRLVESAVWKLTGSQEKGTVAAGWGGRIIVIALVAWFVALPLLSGGRPDYSLIIITALVCSFLWMGATASIEQARLRGRLPLVEAGALAEPAVGLPEWATVAEVLALAPDPVTGTAPAVVLYRPDGRPAAVV